ncbi:MAG TPA: phage tail protein [Chloroflexota bacterium]|nr:phage tail protein [Chloroflexota bacterium]
MAVQYSVPDPFIAAKFWVEIGGIASGFFTECSGLSAETEIFEYAEGGLNDFVHKLPVRTKYSNIVLKRGWVETDDLWKWYQKTIDGRIEAKSVSILVYENKVQSPSNPKARWDLIQAYPVKWQGPEFNADIEGVVVETLEIAHRGWQRQ